MDDDAIRLIVKTGKGHSWGKSTSRTRIIPIHHTSRRLLFLDMKWRDQYFVDLALPFGLRPAPRVFSTPWPTVMSGFKRTTVTMTHQIWCIISRRFFSRWAPLGRFPVRNRLARCNAPLQPLDTGIPLAFGGLS